MFTHYEDNEVKLKEADALLRDAKNILSEADKLRRYGLKVQAQAYQQASDAQGDIDDSVS